MAAYKSNFTTEDTEDTEDCGSAAFAKPFWLSSVTSVSSVVHLLLNWKSRTIAVAFVLKSPKFDGRPLSLPFSHAPSARWRVR